ncbi:hypothetical protein VOLCADRAFT_91788 [Volvox carteri f. nagariensis]|uniref:Helicase C-terminal domain-containing protein n=1 Tax=Volvox carteri f. nagariensis TaxID=3068 RepID=D8TXY6_VOLCA|nr:uncharacterized protein VOLCADRAFT_91788 [Volvox carteri f. nagariensis]EFJ47804.1 hypothetical protein VOLCADRAFT_91788 [Volvox carteri f. nagariensis]|eukprot:XP_002951275.1 hypothetical protein VOLCADRAFT_91788 [Volvox carteri f. nagariensis]
MDRLAEALQGFDGAVGSSGADGGGGSGGGDDDDGGVGGGGAGGGAVWQGVNYVRIDGSHDSGERRTAVMRFRDDPTVRVALLSITAAAVGLDFSAASAVVFVELPNEVHDGSEASAVAAAAGPAAAAAAAAAAGGGPVTGLAVDAVVDLELQQQVDEQLPGPSNAALVAGTVARGGFGGAGGPSGVDSSSRALALAMTACVEEAMPQPSDLQSAGEDAAKASKAAVSEAGDGGRLDIANGEERVAAGGLNQQLAPAGTAAAAAAALEMRPSQLPAPLSQQLLYDSGMVPMTPGSIAMTPSRAALLQMLPASTTFYFEVSCHTSRVHLHLAPDGSRPVGLSLPVELLRNHPQSAMLKSILDEHAARWARERLTAAANRRQRRQELQPPATAVAALPSTAAVAVELLPPKASVLPCAPSAPLAQAEVPCGDAAAAAAAECPSCATGTVGAADTDANAVAAAAAARSDLPLAPVQDPVPLQGRLRCDEATAGCVLATAGGDGDSGGDDSGNGEQDDGGRAARLSFVGPVGLVAPLPSLSPVQLAEGVAEAAAFVRDWCELRAVSRNRLYGAVLERYFQDALEAVTSEAVAAGAYGTSTTRYVQGAPVKVPEGATLHPVQVRTEARYGNAAGNGSSGGGGGGSGDSSSGWRTYQQAFLLDGRVRLCLNCGKPVQDAAGLPASTPLMTTDLLFCDPHCETAYFVKASGGALRRTLARLEHGVCQMCGLDCANLVRQLQTIRATSRDFLAKRRAVVERLAPRLTRHGYTTHLERLLRQATEGLAWQADHITPVYAGGGLCDVDNMRTLCVACHADVTKAQCKQRAAERQQRRLGTRDIRTFWAKPPPGGGGGLPPLPNNKRRTDPWVVPANKRRRPAAGRGVTYIDTSDDSPSQTPSLAAAVAAAVAVRGRGGGAGAGRYGNPVTLKAVPCVGLYGDDDDDDNVWEFKVIDLTTGGGAAGDDGVGRPVAVDDASDAAAAAVVQEVVNLADSDLGEGDEEQAVAAATAAVAASPVASTADLAGMTQQQEKGSQTVKAESQSASDAADGFAAAAAAAAVAPAGGLGGRSGARSWAGRLRDRVLEGRGGGGGGDGNAGKVGDEHATLVPGVAGATDDSVVGVLGSVSEQLAAAAAAAAAADTATEAMDVSVARTYGDCVACDDPSDGTAVGADVHSEVGCGGFSGGGGDGDGGLGGLAEGGDVEGKLDVAALPGTLLKVKHSVTQKDYVINRWLGREQGIKVSKSSGYYKPA